MLGTKRTGGATHLHSRIARECSATVISRTMPIMNSAPEADSGTWALSVSESAAAKRWPSSASWSAAQLAEMQQRQLGPHKVVTSAVQLRSCLRLWC
jgi:hypothetical protein